MSPLIREGHEIKDNQAPLIDTSIVSPEYFHLLGMTRLRGRLFSGENLENTLPIAVINEAAARTYWPNQEPLGKRFRLNPAKPAWTTIVSVLADARTESLADASIPPVYLSLYQRRAKDLAILLRGQLDPGAIETHVRQPVQSVDAGLPVFRAETLDDVLSSSLSVRRFAMEMVAFFAASLASRRAWNLRNHLLHSQ